MASISFEGQPAVPGHKPVMVPATPRDAREMMTAHRVDDILRALSHAGERMGAALRATTAKARHYQSIHIVNHVTHALNEGHMLLQNLRDNYPVEARELETLRQTIALAVAVSPSARTATTAHLMETTLHELAHAKRHADLMLRDDPKPVWAFNADHSARHVKGAHEHAAKLGRHLLDNYPAEGRWLRMLRAGAEGQELALSGTPRTLEEAHYTTTTSKGRNCHTCEYSTAWHGQDGTCTMFKAPIQRGHVCDEWEAEKAELAGNVMDTPVPARKPDQYGLHQVPSQVITPSPPTPPRSTLPTPAEVRSLIKLVPEGIDPSLSTGTRKALETAAVKLEKSDPVEALAMLRQAQSSLYAASRKDAGYGRPAVYGPQLRPPAEQSSALAKMQIAYQDQLQAWRKIGTEVATLIDRIRRNYFHGHVNGYLPNMRM